MLREGAAMSGNELELLRQQILELTKQYADKLLAPKTFTPGEDPVPVSGKVLTSDDFTSLVDSSLDGWLTAGRFTVDFERATLCLLIQDQVQIWLHLVA